MARIYHLQFITAYHRGWLNWAADWRTAADTLFTCRPAKTQTVVKVALKPCSISNNLSHANIMQQLQTFLASVYCILLQFYFNRTEIPLSRLFLFPSYTLCISFSLPICPLSADTHTCTHAHTHTFASVKLWLRCKERCLAVFAGRCLSHGQPDRLRLNLPI